MTRKQGSKATGLQGNRKTWLQSNKETDARRPHSGLCAVHCSGWKGNPSWQNVGKAKNSEIIEI